MLHSRYIGNAGYEVGLWAADFRKGEMKPAFFRSPLHCAKLSNDGLLYACDRNNNRVELTGQPINSGWPK